ncbi:MAG: TatD family deoxyribonuclease, partial [Chitinophagia bacterium]|nr:TatD family deoxyribonuclease [Chitinophagia bacterium]
VTADAVNLERVAFTSYEREVGVFAGIKGEKHCVAVVRHDGHSTGERPTLSRVEILHFGEVGLDYHWDTTFKEQQQEALRYQADLALHYNLPLIMHTREAMADCIELIRSKQNGSLTGIFHCFGGTLAEAQAIIELGFYLGIGGVLTYKKSGLAEVLAGVPLDRLVLETDAPYLAPDPYRGKRNESSHIPYIAAHIAKTLKIPMENVASITTKNAKDIFKSE